MQKWADQGTILTGIGTLQDPDWVVGGTSETISLHGLLFESGHEIFLSGTTSFLGEGDGYKRGGDGYK